MGYFNFENSPSEKTPLSAENLLAMQKGLMELVFPIGSTYITQSDTNPSTILQFGTWERLKGKVIVGVDEDDEDFNTIGAEIGEKTHTLTIPEMPEHDHDIKNSSNGLDGGSDWTVSNSGGSNWKTGKTGENQPFNIIQPTKVVGYMWIRTA